MAPVKLICGPIHPGNSVYSCCRNQELSGVGFYVCILCTLASKGVVTMGYCNQLTSGVLNRSPGVVHQCGSTDWSRSVAWFSPLSLLGKFVPDRQYFPLPLLISVKFRGWRR